MSEPQFDWTRIKGIRYSFHRHTLNKYSDCHAFLNESLSSDIEFPADTLFLEAEITPEEATLVNDFTTRIRDEIVLDIIHLMMDAPSTFNNDSEHITSLFAESMMRYKDGNRQVPIRTTKSFTKAAQKAIDEEKNYIEIILSIDHWHFDRKKWTAMNFEHVSLQEIPQESTANTTQGDNNMTQEQGTMMTILERIVDKMNSNNNRQPGQQTDQGVRGQMGTANTGNPAYYNKANMPDLVRERYEKKDESKILTSNEMKPFILPNPTPEDPNATITSNYFVDGPRVVTRDGTLFDLTFHDQSKPASKADKTFLATFPKLYGEHPHVVRKWYREVLDHCKRLNIYLHPYYLFRKKANHIRGFTIGDSESDDLPSKFQFSIDTWSVLLYEAIRSDKVIPETCVQMRQTMVNYQSGSGYETIYALISMTHPHHLRYPHDLIRAPPAQRPGERLESYYFRYIDFLSLRAYLKNIPGSLDDEDEVSTFIQGTLDRKELRRKTDEERTSSSEDKKEKYKSGALLRTLQVYVNEITREQGGVRRFKQVSVPTSRHRRSPRLRDSHSTKSNSPTSSLTTTSINLIDMCGLPEVDQEDNDAEKWHGVYCAAVNSISSQPKLFDTSQQCLVCRKTGHAFDKCPVLNDIPSLKEHRIAVAVLIKKILDGNRKLLEHSAAIAQLDVEPEANVSWTEEDEYYEDMHPAYEEIQADFLQG